MTKYHAEYIIAFLAKIMRLPGLLVGLEIGEDWEPMPFIFNGGEGLLRKEVK